MDVQLNLKEDVANYPLNLIALAILPTDMGHNQNRFSYVCTNAKAAIDSIDEKIVIFYFLKYVY